MGLMPSIETAVGLCRTGENTGTIDVGAGAVDGALVVADGMGGHCTGWLGARLAVHAVLDSLDPSEERRVVGAADALPDDWGWTGDHPKKTYDKCAAELGDRSSRPRELTALFHAIDSVVAQMQQLAGFDLLVGCIAARTLGTRIIGAHAGVGRALVLRARTTEVESLVVEHYMHLVPDRVSLPGYDRAREPPPNVIINGLGQLRVTGVGIDRFETDLEPGDLFIASSRRLPISDDELLQAARGAGPYDLARTIERMSSARSDGTQAVAFVIAGIHARVGDDRPSARRMAHGEGRDPL